MGGGISVVHRPPREARDRLLGRTSTDSRGKSILALEPLANLVHW